MGRGRAKGWRPPRGESAGALFGSVDHLSGNSIASPVQLRWEGIPMPTNHPNYGEEFVKGKDGKGGSWVRTTPLPKTEPAPAPEPKATPKELTLPKANPKAKPKAAPGSSSASSANGTVKEEVKPVVKQEVKTEVKKEVKRELKQESDDGLTEIERRRRAMVALQAAKAEVKEEVKEEAGAEEPEAKRPRTEAESKPSQSGAVQSGLQGWAMRVNALAGEDGDLVNKCREFVRKRILEAHADGNLHSVDWEAEPVPSADEVAAS